MAQQPAPPSRNEQIQASLNASERISSPLASEGDFERELRTGLGLLLKHRGGPGFGTGRLQGIELDSLEEKLRSITTKLAQEIEA